MWPLNPGFTSDRRPHPVDQQAGVMASLIHELYPRRARLRGRANDHADSGPPPICRSRNSFRTGRCEPRTCKPKSMHFANDREMKDIGLIARRSGMIQPLQFVAERLWFGVRRTLFWIALELPAGPLNQWLMAVALGRPQPTDDGE
jgi:hypothetical protein